MGRTPGELSRSPSLARAKSTKIETMAANRALPPRQMKPPSGVPGQHLKPVQFRNLWPR